MPEYSNPKLLGDPTAPTRDITDDSEAIATTEFVHDAVEATQFTAVSSFTTTTTDPNQVILTIDATVYRAIKFVIQITSGAEYEATELICVHDGSSAFLTQYASVKNGGDLCDLDADIFENNIRLLATPVNPVTTIKSTYLPIKA